MFLIHHDLIPGELYGIYPLIMTANDTIIPLGSGLFLKNANEEIYQYSNSLNSRVKTFSFFLIKNEIQKFESEKYSFLPINWSEICSI